MFPQIPLISLHLSVMFIHIALDHQLQETYTNNFYVQICQKKNLSGVGVRLWNKIPEDLRKMSKKKFKKN